MQQYRFLISLPADTEQPLALLTLCPDCIDSVADHGVLEMHDQTDRPCELCGDLGDDGF